MLVFTPLGLASQSLGWGQVATFGLCFLAIIPLAKLFLGPIFEEKTAFCVVSVVEIFEVDEFLEKRHPNRNQ